MENNQRFIKLILNCENILEGKIFNSRDFEDIRRYNLMLDELKGLMTTTKQEKLNTKQYYLSITQMLDKNDPDDVIAVVLKLNEFYCRYYQKL
ncbi:MULTISPECIES: hypothetical protein [unclassified Bacillus (in: firmicutes)]|uniref:hypothetical protein n=1 Tax=unclassified Bacillus (in: firmicutes) TaxID=185979 RepID=UPI003837CA8C